MQAQDPREKDDSSREEGGNIHVKWLGTMTTNSSYAGFGN